MSNQLCFLDSNIWLYYLLENQSSTIQESKRKRNIAQSLTNSENLIVSTQVINEVCVNALKKANFTEAQIKLLIQTFENRCTVIAPRIEILNKASDLRSQHYFSFWDSLIVASALFANAEILYSEDMQDNLILEQRLMIVNPFK
ncbi:MAG: PIN domain-containing protein [Myxacorys chilensis ATA2-1-KO14]|jgi:predicted nucleic acid-binding protein|nr:PIN domain-containing protein [Myxacorys chilensis ATA2-1-KO14]